MNTHDPAAWPLDELLVLGAAYLQSSVAGWLAAPATPNQCAHFATGGTPG